MSAGFVLFACVMALVMVGIQRGYQARAKQDLEEVRQLTILIPDPPPSAVFAPVHIEPPAQDARDGRFENYFWSSFCSWWAGKWVVRHAYSRADLDAGAAFWDRSSIAAAKRAGVVVREARRASWHEVIPFVIRRDGKVELVTSVVCQTTDGLLEIEIPATSRLPIPRLTWVIERIP